MALRYLLLSAALVADTVQAINCDLVKIAPIVADANAARCKVDTGFDLLSAPGIPGSQQLASMCASPACASTIAALRTVVTRDCDLTLGPTPVNVYRLVVAFDSSCTPQPTAPAADTCPNSELIKVVSLMTDVNVPRCSAASGYDFPMAQGMPNTQQLAAMCATPACIAMASSINAIDPIDCELAFAGGTVNMYQIVDALDANCDAFSRTPESTTPAPTTAQPTYC